MKSVPGGSIGKQVAGELGELAKDVAKGMADAPKHIVSGSDKKSESSSTSSSGDQEGAALEAGQQIGDSSQAKQSQQQTTPKSWGDTFKSQIFGDNQKQKRLTEVRRNLEQEVQRVRKQKEQAEEQQKQQEEQQQEMVKKQQQEQKKEGQKQSKIKQMLGLGKGERRGTKGK